MADVRDAEVTVVGGGAVGCAVLYHLAEAGCADLQLVEAGELAGATSGQAAGLVGQVRTTPERTALAMASVALFSRLQRGSPWPIDWRQTGSLRIATTAERVAEFDRMATVAVLAEALDQRGADLAVLPDLAVLTELRLACGLNDDAAQSARAVTELATADVGEALRGYDRLVAGMIALSAYNDVGARESLRQAVRHFAAARLPMERARAQVTLAEACAAADPGTALAEARAAAETFAWLDATGELDRASAVLRSVGGRRPPPVSGPGDLLTTREHEVLVLVAEGLSNPEIADRLFLSRKTVAHHVSNVLAKLGVRNRAEAAAWFGARTARSGSDEP